MKKFPISNDVFKITKNRHPYKYLDKVWVDVRTLNTQEFNPLKGIIVGRGPPDIYDQWIIKLIDKKMSKKNFHTICMPHYKIQPRLKNIKIKKGFI